MIRIQFAGDGSPLFVRQIMGNPTLIDHRESFVVEGIEARWGPVVHTRDLFGQSVGELILMTAVGGIAYDTAKSLARRLWESASRSRTTLKIEEREPSSEEELLEILWEAHGIGGADPEVEEAGKEADDEETD